MCITDGIQKQEIPLGLCQCGCGEETNICPVNCVSRGFIKGQPFRFIKSHGNARPLADKFWEKVDVKSDSECWLWKGSVDRKGYGKFGNKYKTEISSRVAYKLAYGKLEHGESVLHACDNPPCCNPSHLFKGTQQDNVNDMIRKGRHGNMYRKPVKLLDS